MEALSPRSANIPFKAKPMKTKQQTEEEAKLAEAAKKAAKEKEYAPPPPDWVIQPPISRGGLAEKFWTGRLLGKGGFAICYEGELRSKKQGANKTVFALKIVKAQMSQRKMEDKVCINPSAATYNSDAMHSSVPSCKYMLRCVTPILLNSIEPSLSRRAPMLS